ncbi:acyl-CoA dehydrogenase family protein [Chitinivorax sp. B]|uniref:acyl-CoA dehydrogenase family protein n=1 Tax=Chitinivorax sp. B TaxID=2502235 RepID=UPI0010F8528D|nr:acyl-CoA dehydrogenase family protein [Chitinivorax sp. B]
MQLTLEHEQMRRTAKQFVEQEINPNAEEWERAGRFPAHDLFKKLGDLGLLGIHKPVENGGLGLNVSYNLGVVEEFGRAVCGGVPLAIGVQTDMATPALARFGSRELRDEFLTPAIAGDYVASIAVSEPHAGSDVAAIKTVARKDGGDYVIDGTKMWITNSLQADFFCLLANTSEGHRHANKSLIVVPAGAKGISFSKPLNKLGMRSSDTAQVFFDSVRVPLRYCIGQENTGFMMQMMQFQEERLFGAANTIGAVARCIELTTDYARERQVFGMSLLDNQTVHFRLAELRTELEALRALTYQACEKHISGEDVTLLASMAKLKAGRLVREVADSCLQFWGGQGYMWDNPAAQLYRDGRLCSIGAGADEIMLGIICKLTGTLPGKRPA